MKGNKCTHVERMRRPYPGQSKGIKMTGNTGEGEIQIWSNNTSLDEQVLSTLDQQRGEKFLLNIDFCNKYTVITSV